MDVRRFHARSYYASSASSKGMRSCLQGEAESDICIVGAGFTGLSVALELAEKGFKVLVLEAKVIGYGASGRNGGQIVNGLNADFAKMRAGFGQKFVDFVGPLMDEGSEIIRQRIRDYAIACDYKPGNIFAAFTPKQIAAMEDKKTEWAAYGVDNFEMLGKAAIKEHIGSDAYLGGMLDHKGGHFHPLNFALGEARAIESLDGRIYENSPVKRIEIRDGKYFAHTHHGQVKAQTLILAGNAYMQGVMPSLEARILPCSTQVMATEPLGARAQALLPTDLCVEDVRYILDYYRLSSDKRLLWGGGTVYGGKDPASVEAKLRKNMVKIFPMLSNVKIDYAWSGNFALSFSRVPQMGRTDKGIYYAFGYSGHGVTGSQLFGRILAEAIDGDLRRFDVFAALGYIPFPGGRALRVPYSLIGSWWYGIRDRLGL